MVLSSDDILDCDEAVVFEAATRWLGSHSSFEDRSDTAIVLAILRTVRYPLMDAGNSPAPSTSRLPLLLIHPD